MSADSVAQDQLKAIVRRIEAMEDEIRALNQDKSEIYKEAKGNGFDVKVLRKVIAARRLDASERDEADAIFDLYWAAIHGSERLVRAHVEIIEQFDPETGEIEPQPRAAQDGGAFSEVKGSARLENAVGVEPSPSNEPAAAPQTTAAVAGEGAHHPTSPAIQSALRDVGGTTGPERRPADASAPGRDGVVAAPAPILKPGTFLNSKGLLRLDGCRYPETCAGSAVKLCYGCSPAAQHAESAE